MNEYNARVLAARINYFLEESSFALGKCIKFGLLLEGAKQDRNTLRLCLMEWERQGFLRMLKNPDECSSDDYCVEMLSSIDLKNPT
jgi:hypothetical protein